MPNLLNLNQTRLDNQIRSIFIRLTFNFNQNTSNFVQIRLTAKTHSILCKIWQKQPKLIQFWVKTAKPGKIHSISRKKVAKPAKTPMCKVKRIEFCVNMIDRVSMGKLTQKFIQIT